MDEKKMEGMFKKINDRLDDMDKKIKNGGKTAKKAKPAKKAKTKSDKRFLGGFRDSVSDKFAKWWKPVLKYGAAAGVGLAAGKGYDYMNSETGEEA